MAYAPFRFIEAFGKRQTIMRWAAELGLKANTIRHRLSRRGRGVLW
jgi:hypothetical protein